MNNLVSKRAPGRPRRIGLTPLAMLMAIAGAMPADPVAASDRIDTAIAQKHRALDGAEGQLGAAVGPVRTNPDGIGKRRQYGHGHIYWSPETGTHVLYYGSIRDQWAEQKWEQGPLGYPASDPSPANAGRIHVQEFTGGRFEAPSAPLRRRARTDREQPFEPHSLKA